MLVIIVLAFSLFQISLSKSVQVTCNGSPSLCNRSYSNVTQIGSHDSPFVGTLPTDNQNVGITTQLSAGIRFLQAQTHKNANGTLSLCHTFCELRDAGPLNDYLSTIKTWLDVNPNEVLTLLLTNGDRLNITEFGSAFSSSGLVPAIYVPPSNPLPFDAWPTLQHMITSGKRLVVFLDYGANHAKVPYILDEFAHFFETPYDTIDPAFPECSLDRPPNASPHGRMYIVNHFLDLNYSGILVPDDQAANQTNSATGSGGVSAQVGLCRKKYGRLPKGVLVDFFDKGEVFAAQDALNGL